MVFVIFFIHNYYYIGRKKYTYFVEKLIACPCLSQ